MRVTGSAIRRELRVVPVLAHDERAAVGGVAALLGAVAARMEDQLTSMGIRGHGDRSRAGGEAQVPEPERDEGDHGEAGDPAASEAFRGGSFAVARERLVMQQDGLHGGSLSRVVRPRWSLR